MTFSMVTEQTLPNDEGHKCDVGILSNKDVLPNTKTKMKGAFHRFYTELYQIQKFKLLFF